MEVCECGNPTWEHHPSFHYAQKRDEMMTHVKVFMDAVYPESIFGTTFNRKQVELIAACFCVDRKAEG